MLRLTLRSACDLEADMLAPEASRPDSVRIG
jgi:hypothetical protein